MSKWKLSRKTARLTRKWQTDSYEDEKEYCARCGAELTDGESYLCDFCRYEESR